MENDTFIISLTEWLVGKARKLSFFYLAEIFCGKPSFAFVDAWTLSFLVMSMAAYVAALLISSGIIQAIIVIFSAIRVFEYLVYLFWVVLFAKPNKGTTDLRSYRRSLLLLMSNYIETIFWFATWLTVLTAGGSIKVQQGPDALFRESIMLMVANWSGNLLLNSRVAVLVVAVCDIVGLYMTIVIASRIISLLPRPTSADPDENQSKN